jgi:hypothetical protein
MMPTNRECDQVDNDHSVDDCDDAAVATHHCHCRDRDSAVVTRMMMMSWRPLSYAILSRISMHIYDITDE